MEKERVMTNTEQELQQGTMVKCLCCGSECYDKYCPSCGQSTTTKRLTFTAMVNYILYGMLKMNGGFLYTVKELFIHPWKVIRDYIQGRRVVYMQPFLLLIAVTLYYTIFHYLLGLDLDIEKLSFRDMFEGEDINNFGEQYVNVLDYLTHNMFFLNMSLIPPFILAVYSAYKKCGSRRFNWVEYVIAATFILCLNVMIDILFLPTRLIPNFPFSNVSTAIITVYCFLSLWNAFPMGSVKSRIGRILAFSFLAFLYAFLYILLLVILNMFFLTMSVG